ncbi:hypothetical protein SAMN02910406_02801 [Ruminococcus albus]|uniref:Uncharacterized protein n=1 Tax=Ruminococcus albus TaxID=1264 RepID=A0A1I1NXP5_RUMAL|nr:hypothetical protein SAMN02910406_02801 [Ruminococcus albus]
MLASQRIPKCATVCRRTNYSQNNFVVSEINGSSSRTTQSLLVDFSTQGTMCENLQSTDHSQYPTIPTNPARHFFIMSIHLSDEIFTQ